MLDRRFFAGFVHCRGDWGQGGAFFKRTCFYGISRRSTSSTFDLKWFIPTA